MFQHEGPARSERNNRRVAAYLAWTGGYVNSAGFVLLGIFTSHVTGNVGRLATDISRHDVKGTLGALTMIAAFFAGAVLASVIIESAAFRSRSHAYGAALALEATLLLIFVLLPTCRIPRQSASTTRRQRSSARRWVFRIAWSRGSLGPSCGRPI
jgi:uncharacterized membrane protein YoaK (UPF0700 family)